MVLVHLLLAQLLMTLACGDFVPNVTVSTLEGVSFTGYIFDMKPHPSDPNSLLLTDRYAILSLNVLTKQTSTVAGAVSSRGYVEGVGESARFFSPYSLIIINEKRIIVSDDGNHCLRDVDISTGQTNPLAGTCQSHGFRNGEALQAQFTNPRGLLQYKTGVLVADRNTNAVRWLNAGRVSTLVQGSPVRYPNYFTERDGVVYISTLSGVLKLDPDTAAVQLIAGHESSEGFSDGPLLSARFDWARGLVSLSPDVFLLADSSNKRLRLLDLQNNTVRSICTGTRASVDGAADRCQLIYPLSITILNEMIYVGDVPRIRTIPLQSLIRKDPPKVEGVIEFCPPSVNLTIPAGQTAVHHAWPQPEIEGGDVACIMCLKGNSQLFPPGETLISYIYPSNVAASQRVECNFTVSVTEVCPPSSLKTTTKIRESFANVEIADSNHRLPAGNHSVETKLTDGKICITTVEVTDENKPLLIRNCPDNVSLTITAGEHMANYSWTEPAAEGTGNISCTGCPSRPSGIFNLGVTKIVYTFRSDVGMDAVCSFSVTVKDVCPPAEVNVLLKPGEATASVEMFGRTLTYPRGEFRITSTLSDGTKCTTSINITSSEPVAAESCPPSLIEKTLEPGQDRTTVDAPSGKLVLPAGETPFTTRLSNGTECLTTIIVKEGFEVSCPSSITTQLQKSKKKTKVSWSMPHLKGVNQSDVECSSCPANSAEFGVGVHTVEYKYTYAPTNFSLSCSFVVVVISPDNGEQRCSPVVLGLKRGDRTAGFVIETYQKNISIQLTVGVHELKTTDQSGDTCLTAVKVYDTKPVGRSVLLQASYPAECEKLNGISYLVIKSNMIQHFTGLVKLCPECHLVGDQPYEMNCQAGVLDVQWTTGIKTDIASGSIPAAVKSPLLEKLKSIQDTFLSLNGRFFDITVLTGTALVVSPVRNNDGLYLRLRVVASCPLPQMVYDNVDDACYIP